jgi:hypothetical protein
MYLLKWGSPTGFLFCFIASKVPTGLPTLREPHFGRSLVTSPPFLESSLDEKLQNLTYKL